MAVEDSCEQLINRLEEQTAEFVRRSDRLATVRATRAEMRQRMLADGVGEDRDDDLFSDTSRLV